MNKKKIILIIAIVAIVILSVLAYNKFSAAGKNTNNGSSGNTIKTVALSDEDQIKITQILQSSDFIKDIPENGVIGLIFYNFENGERVLNNGYLLGKNKFLSSGEPDFQILLHSKYIKEIDENNLCDIVIKAKQNGDMAYYSDKSKAMLLLKYGGMLKYKDCFGL